MGAARVSANNSSMTPAERRRAGCASISFVVGGAGSCFVVDANERRTADHAEAADCVRHGS